MDAKRPAVSACRHIVTEESIHENAYEPTDCTSTYESDKEMNICKTETPHSPAGRADIGDKFIESTLHPR